jgi:hypothetical protein
MAIAFLTFLTVLLLAWPIPHKELHDSATPGHDAEERESTSAPQGALFFCRLALYCKKQQRLNGGGLARYCELVRLFSMQSFFAFAALSGMLTVLAWSYVTHPQQPDNQQAYSKCIEHHPQQYCRFEHLPSTITHKQR